MQDYRRFFARFDGDLVDQWQALRCGPGRPGHPLHAYLKACVLRIRKGLIYSSHLRRFLLNHPLLVIELGLRLEPDPAQPYDFDLDKTVPCAYWLRQQLHRCDHELLQALLKATFVALKEEIPGLSFGLSAIPTAWSRRCRKQSRKFQSLIRGSQVIQN